MNQELFSFVVNVGETFIKSVPISLALAGVFTVLTYFWACNPGRAWWHKRDLVTDLCYWFFIPILTRYLAHRHARCRSRSSVRHHDG